MANRTQQVKHPDEEAARGHVPSEQYPEEPLGSSDYVVPNDSDKSQYS